MTAAEIAARAGVTERTYFRHFPDKREVLFDGERALTEWVTEALASVPADVPLRPAIRRTVDLIVPPLEANRPDSDRLAAIVAATPALRERAVSKEARLVAIITDLLLTGPLLVKRAAELYQAEVPGPVTDLLKSGRSTVRSCP